MNRAERDAALPVAHELGATILPPAKVPSSLHEAMAGGVLDPAAWHVPHLVLTFETPVPAGTAVDAEAHGPATVHVIRVHVLGRSDEPPATGIVALHEGWRLPEMLAVPEGPMDRLGELFGGSDIDFDGDREFSDAFKVTGSSERRIRALLRAEVRRRFLQLHPVVVESRRSSILLLFRDPLPLEQVPERVALAVGLVRELVE